ncbi:MAG: hypothetical protein ACFN4H_06310, partial [Prevotella sp.]
MLSPWRLVARGGSDGRFPSAGRVFRGFRPQPLSRKVNRVAAVVSLYGGRGNMRMAAVARSYG